MTTVIFLGAATLWGMTEVVSVAWATPATPPAVYTKGRGRIGCVVVMEGEVEVEEGEVANKDSGVLVVAKSVSVWGCCGVGVRVKSVSGWG